MEIESADSQKMDFMKLLLTQLENQNPLEPMDNYQMAEQLATFSQLELSEEMNTGISSMNSTMEQMNSSFQGAMLVAEFDYAKSLLGKEVSFYSGPYEQFVNGDVQKVSFVDGKPILEVHGTVRQEDGTQSGEMIFPVQLHEVAGIKD